MTQQQQRTILFIDGNNFYHGMKDIGLSPPGLDFSLLSRKLICGREWIETRYYIGKLKQESNPELYRGQRRFLDSLKKQDRISIFLGHVESRPAQGAARKLNHWLQHLDKHSLGDSVPSDIVKELRDIADTESIQYVEKAVDVMIATDMVSMAYESKYDVAYLLSADGDFAPAVKKVKEVGQKVFVASPTQGHKISQVADKFIRLNQEFFHGCWK